MPVGRGSGEHGGPKKIGSSPYFSAPYPHVIKPTATTHGQCVLSPVSLASRDQDGGPSNGKIGDCACSLGTYGMRDILLLLPKLGQLFCLRTRL